MGVKGLAGLIRSPKVEKSTSRRRHHDGPRPSVTRPSRQHSTLMDDVFLVAELMQPSKGPKAASIDHYHRLREVRSCFIPTGSLIYSSCFGDPQAHSTVKQFPDVDRGLVSFLSTRQLHLRLCLRLLLWNVIGHGSNSLLRGHPMSDRLQDGTSFYLRLASAGYLYACPL